MTNTKTLLIRPANVADVPLLTDWTSVEPVAWIDADRLTEELGTVNYRPEWSWIAEQAGQPVGRALWWGRTGADRPTTLDCLSR